MNTVLIVMIFAGGRFGDWIPVRAVEYPSWEACEFAKRTWYQRRTVKNNDERVECAPVIKE